MSNESRARIGWIGAGAVGLPMLTRLAAAGHRVLAYDNDPARLSLARDAGADVVASPAQAAADSDAVFLNLPNAQIVTEVVFGRDGCIAGGIGNKPVIDTSSIDPVLTRELAARLAQSANGRWIDAPVSGGINGAAQGALVALVGGAVQDVAMVQPWLSAFCTRIVHVGPVGSGQWAKLCNQTIIAGTIALWTEAFALAEAGGIAPLPLLSALAGATADSRVSQAFGAALANGTFVPSANLQKDIATALMRSNEGQRALMAATAKVFDRLRDRAGRS